MRRSKNDDDLHTDESDSDETSKDVHGSREGSVSNNITHGTGTHDKSTSTVVHEKTAAVDVNEAWTRTMKSAKEQVKSLSTDLQQLEKYQALVDMDNQRHEVSRLERELQNFVSTIEQRDIRIEKLSREVSTKDNEMADKEEKMSLMMQEWDEEVEDLVSSREELESTEEELKSTKKELNSTRKELETLRELFVGVKKVFTQGSEQGVKSK
jgi:chromosome segregation ATPase